jgi:DNA polymerase-3 subunit delta'
MKFEKIVGQDTVKTKLIKSVKEQRVPHALMITGPEGTGKLALAIAFAQYLSCHKPTNTDSCGECPSCHKFEKLIHPDLHFVFPVNSSDSKGDGEKAAAKSSDTFIHLWREAILENPYISEPIWYNAIGIENKQGIINTAESSEVIKKLSLKSFEAEYKTMIIWLPERMHISAANKLLKLIEEPPAKTLFILVTEDPENIIRTIISRTQIIRVPPIKREHISTYLVDKVGVTPERAHDISRIANGNFNVALKLIGEHESGPYFDLFRTLMRCCYTKNVLGLLSWVDAAVGLGRERQKELLTYSLEIVRDSLMLNLGLDDIVYLAGDEADFGKKFSPFINGKNIQALNTELNLAIDHIARNGNANIVFTDLAMKLVKLINKN